METKIIKFNKKVYSVENIKKARNEYQSIPGDKYRFILKEDKKYFEVRVISKKFPENFLCEFANFVLSF